MGKGISKRTFLAGLAASGLVPAAALADGARRGTLSNPQASARARSLYRYLNDVWGKHTLTGQQESMWGRGTRYELDYIEELTGKQPAVLGLDYIDPPRRSGVNDRAAAWYNDGGIATICWHWGNPMAGPGYESSKTYFNALAALKDGTPENKALMSDMDDIAYYLGRLRDQDVPVLWRPFHEFTGDWFWWGKLGPKVFKALWVKMYNYFTHEKGLNNLIWVLGYTKDASREWFPGLDYVDIIGADDYVKDHGPLKDMYERVHAITGDTLPITLHECGPIPDPAQLQASGANWLWFLVWHTDFIHDGKSNPADWIKTVYASDWYLKRDQLPDLKTYGV